MENHQYEDKDELKERMIQTNAFGTLNKTACEMDEMRRNTTTYAYLCKLDEAKQWMSIYAPVETIKEFLDELPRGRMLALVAQNNGFECKVHDSRAQKYFEVENIFTFLRFAKEMGLNRNFLFETTDLREGRNIPKVIYCIHALATLLKKKGLGKGIVKNDQNKFTEEEMQMVDNDIQYDMSEYAKIDQHIEEEMIREKELIKEEEIKEQQIKEEEIKKQQQIDQKLKDRIQEELRKKQEEMKKQHEEEMRKQNEEMKEKEIKFISPQPIISFCKTLELRAAFENILYKGKISLCHLRKFLSMFPKEEVEISEMSAEVMERFKNNYEIKKQIDEVYRSIRLLLENQSKLRGIQSLKYPKANDFVLFKKALFLFMNNYPVIGQMLSEGVDFPLRTIYGDHMLGDFYFTKFIFYYKDKDPKIAQETAAKHFMTSDAFSKIRMAFSTREVDFNLNPVEIYLKQNSLSNHGKEDMVEIAMNDETVRNKINSKSMEIIAYLDSMIEFLSNINLPFYCYLFKDQFDLFILPAILASTNYMAGEFLSKIFTTSVKETAVGNCSEINNNVLSEYISQKTISLNETPISEISQINSYFVEQMEYVENADFIKNNASSTHGLKIKINYSIINSLILLLKEHRGKMRGILRQTVEKLSLIQKKSPRRVKNTFLVSNLDQAKLQSDSAKDSGVNSNVQKNINTHLEYSLIANSNVISDGKTVIKGDSDEMFLLDLDHCYIEEDAWDSTISTVIGDTKRKIVALIEITDGNDLMEILFSNYKADDNVDSLKSVLISNLEFLEQNEITFKATKYNEILEMVAKDILRPGELESQLCSETADLIYQRGEALEKTLKNIYSYFTKLSDSMVRNKTSCMTRGDFPTSFYGTYKYPLNLFDCCPYDAFDVSNLSLRILSNDPLVFDLAVMLKTQVLLKTQVSLPDLLKSIEDGIEQFDVENSLSLSTKKLLRAINYNYLNY
ncbi:hypothetical protein NUSPORA_01594 [Nucleospora cyclopteri]